MCSCSSSAAAIARSTASWATPPGLCLERGRPAGRSCRPVCNFPHRHIRFDYMGARANRTALDVFRERTGVCRDYMHLAITLCRSLNLPARHCTGYLGDIGVPVVSPMDFSIWLWADEIA